MDLASHQWMLQLAGESLMRHRIYTWSQNTVLQSYFISIVTLRNAKFWFPGQRSPLTHSSHLLVTLEETCHQEKVPAVGKKASV